jgi:hypothetical protein
MVKVARGLWIVWAILVWNVVFDHVVVVAGRAYIAAAIAAASSGRYARMDDWMQPAITRGLWTATAASAAILVVGFVAIRHATSNKTGAPDRLRQGSGGQAFADAQGGEGQSSVTTGRSEGVA